MVARGEPMSDVFFNAQKTRYSVGSSSWLLERTSAFCSSDKRCNPICTDPSLHPRSTFGVLQTELNLMLNSNPSELATTLIITPMFLDRFEDYLEALALIEHRACRAGWRLQVASFHPDYCFDGVEPADPANFTNRSPWPVFHSARRASRMGDCQPPRHRSGSKKCSAFQRLGATGIKSLLMPGPRKVSVTLAVPLRMRPPGYTRLNGQEQALTVAPGGLHGEHCPPSRQSSLVADLKFEVATVGRLTRLRENRHNTVRQLHNPRAHRACGAAFSPPQTSTGSQLKVP